MFTYSTLTVRTGIAVFITYYLVTIYRKCPCRGSLAAVSKNIKEELPCYQVVAKMACHKLRWIQQKTLDAGKETAIC